MRIWVTGIGLVSPLGRDLNSSMDALLAGRRAFGQVTLFDPSGCRSTIAAQVADLSAAEEAPRGQEVGWSRTDAMAVMAAREALREAGLLESDAGGVASLDVGAGATDLILGGTTAGMFETEDLLAQMHRDPHARRPLEAMLSHPLSATADRMQQVLARFRQSRTLCSACSSGSNALLLGAAWLRTGRTRRVLAGGADGLCRLTYTGFSCLGALSPEPCQPFDAGRRGLNLGEGAAFLVLESEDAARERGAEPLAELRGWAVSAEAHHITNPEPSGETAARVMRRALEVAGISPAELDYVNAHGTATPLNDKMEATALGVCLGEEAKRVGVSSSKGQIGHTLGAAGAVEAAICAYAVQHDVMPPNAGLETLEPAAEHLQVLGQARRGEVRAAMSNSFGFGGSDAVVVLTKPGVFGEQAAPPSRRVVVSGLGSIGSLGHGGLGQAHAYVEPGPTPDPGPVEFDAGQHLDLGRARRIDRAGRLCAAAMKLALQDTGDALTDARTERAGAIMGEAFGSVDDCSAFIHRVYDKGARFASPAVFPNLLPSSPVAHASIYHRLRGPVFATADLSATAECAMVTAVDLIAAGEAERMLAGGVEQSSQIIERVLEPLYGDEHGARSEGACVLVFEDAEAASRPLAEVVWRRAFRGDAPDLSGLEPPPERATLFVAKDDGRLAKLLEGHGWLQVPRAAAAARAGDHEAAGGFAAAAAVAAIAAGDIDAALVVGLAPDRGYFLLLRPWA